MNESFMNECAAELTSATEICNAKECIILIANIPEVALVRSYCNFLTNAGLNKLEDGTIIVFRIIVLDVFSGILELLYAGQSHVTKEIIERYHMYQIDACNVYRVYTIGIGVNPNTLINTLIVNGVVDCIYINEYGITFNKPDNVTTIIGRELSPDLQYSNLFGYFLESISNVLLDGIIYNEEASENIFICERYAKMADDYGKNVLEPGFTSALALLYYDEYFYNDTCSNSGRFINLLIHNLSMGKDLQEIPHINEIYKYVKSVIGEAQRYTKYNICNFSYAHFNHTLGYDANHLIHMIFLEKEEIHKDLLTKAYILDLYATETDTRCIYNNTCLQFNDPSLPDSQDPFRVSQSTNTN